MTPEEKAKAHIEELKKLGAEFDEAEQFEAFLKKQNRHEKCKVMYKNQTLDAIKLMAKYKAEEEFSHNSYGNLDRIVSRFLDVSGTKEADAKNREFLRYISTKEGQAKFTKTLFSKIMDLDFSVIFSDDKDKIIDYAQENYQVVNCAWDPFFIDNLEPDGKYITEEMASFYKEMRVAFQAAAGMVHVVYSYASPEILEDDYDDLGVLAMTEKIMMKHPEAMMTTLDESKKDPIEYFIPMGKFNDDRKTELAGIKKLKEKNIEVNKFSDLAKYKFTDEKGEPINAAYVFSRLADGKQVNAELKSPEELAVAEDSTKESVPSWQELLDFLKSKYGILEDNKSQAMRLVKVDPKTGKCGPLPISAELNGSNGPENKDSFDNIMWIINNSKPLKEYSKEEQDKLLGLISENKIAIYDPFMNGRKSSMLKIDYGRLAAGSSFDASANMDPASKFLEGHLWQKNQSSFSEVGLKVMENSFNDDLFGRKAEALIGKYGLSGVVKYFFVNSGIDPDTVEDFDFMKDKNFEEKKEALNKYFNELFKKTEGYLSEKELNAIEEEGLDLNDIRALAYNQKISVKEYIDQKIIANSVDVEIDKAIDNVNNELREYAGNPLEKEMAEAMIRIKELSFSAGNRAEMDKLLAKYVALRAVEENLGIKKGEATENDPQKTREIEKALSHIDQYAEDVYTNESFKYSLRKISNKEMSDLSRGNTFEHLDKYLDELRGFVQRKGMEDPMVRLDRIRVYSNYAMYNQMFVPDKLNLAGTFKEKPNNPFNLTVDRTSFNTFAVGKMLEKGFDLEDILDPFKLIQVKKDVGEEAFKQYQIGTDENREKIAHSYMTALEKCVEYANKQFSKLDSLNPADIIKLNDPAFFAVGSLLKDSYQELGTLNGIKAFEGKFKDKFDRLSDEVDALDKFYYNAEFACDDILAYSQGKAAQNGNASVVTSHFVTVEYVNKVFETTKKSAAENNKTFSAEIVDQYHSSMESMDSNLARVQIAAGMAANFVNSDISDKALAAIEASAEGKKKLARDMLNGSFTKKMNIKICKINSPADKPFTAEPSKYFEQIKKEIKLQPMEPRL